jgi:transposase
VTKLIDFLNRLEEASIYYKLDKCNDEYIMVEVSVPGERYYELVMSFPHSNAQVCLVLPSENAVCFLHGLQELFQLIGGVPQVIRFDNLTPAVAKVLSGGERSLTEMFKAFQWHFRFQAEFCTPSRGQEKGHVENKVGYVRRNNFSPLPVINDLDEFNRTLNEKMIADRDRNHYAKGILISSH